MKIDPYKHERKYRKWLETARDSMRELSTQNIDLILRYINDMEYGLNVARGSVKGGRSYIRLNTLREKMVFFCKKFKEVYGIDDITKISEDQAIQFFSRMRKGEITREDGREYKSVGFYVRVFKAFWHWWQAVNKKTGIVISDITLDLDTKDSKPKWVYLAEEQVRKLCDNAKPNYRTMILFLYDTGIRSPTELINVRVSDLYEGCKTLNIREEIVKGGSFGRKINLMLCSGLLKQHVADNGLQPHDQLFDISPPVVNRYLRRLAKRVLGEGVSLAGEKYSNLTMYDFRHCSCCYWLPRYKSESALKYRFGWRKSDKIHYYSELLGMKDTITEEDLLLDLTKTELERRLLKTEQDNTLLKEKIDSYNTEVKKLRALMAIYTAKLDQIQEMRLAA